MGQVHTTTVTDTIYSTYSTTRYITRTLETLTTETQYSTATKTHTRSVTSTLRATETKIVTTHSPYPEWYDNTVLGLWVVGYILLLAVLGGIGFAFVSNLFYGKRKNKEDEEENEGYERDPLLVQPGSSRDGYGGYGSRTQPPVSPKLPKYTPVSKNPDTSLYYQH